MHDLIREGNKDAVVALFKQGIEPNERRFITQQQQQQAQSQSQSQSYSAPVTGSELVAVDGETPLMAAARFNRTEIIVMLLKAPELKINMVDTAKGWTALFHAAVTGSEGERGFDFCPAIGATSSSIAIARPRQHFRLILDHIIVSLHQPSLARAISRPSD